MIKQNAYKAIFIHHYLYIIKKRNNDRHWAHCNQPIKLLDVSCVELFNYYVKHLHICTSISQDRQGYLIRGTEC